MTKTNKIFFISVVSYYSGKVNEYNLKMIYLQKSVARSNVCILSDGTPTLCIVIRKLLL